MIRRGVVVLGKNRVIVGRCLFHSWRGPLLSGHNKWSTIKHDKMKNDSIKNKLSNKFSNQITMAVKLKDPNLQNLLDKAAKSNISKRVIENAIKKGEGHSSVSGSNITLNVYEGVGPGGCNVIVETATDNKNRTVASVRTVFNKFGGNMTSNGSCLHYFDKVGIVTLGQSEDGANTTEDTVLDAVVDLPGVVDISAKEEVTVLTEPSETNKIALRLRDEGFVIDNATVGYIPRPENMTTISSPELQETYAKFLDGLESLDEVVKVYSTAHIPH